MGVYSDIFILSNILIVGFCIFLNTFTLIKYGKIEFYVFITLFFLLLTNSCKAKLHSLISIF